MSDTPHCYAVRRLNPFMGVLQVVEIPGGRALSQDGHQWELQVEAERPEHTWGSIEPTRMARQFFRFGGWNAEQGLSRVPANPLLDLGAMLTASEQLVAALRETLPQLPFAFEDRYECWWLDAQQQPLALLASTTENRFTEQIRVQGWQATLATDPTFVAPSLEARGIPRQDAQGPRRHAAVLERQVQDAVGAAPNRAWYRRRAEGDGAALDPHLAALPATAFPALPLRMHWPDPDQQALVDDYLAWLAPRLLTLDGLDDRLRGELERAACAQAVLLAEHYALYPRVLQRERLDAARVEARLRRTAG
jgi:hypothetical protein